MGCCRSTCNLPACVVLATAYVKFNKLPVEVKDSSRWALHCMFHISGAGSGNRWQCHLV